MSIGKPWTLRELGGRPILLMWLQGTDAHAFDQWVPKLIAAVGPMGVTVRPLLDASPIPKVVWWGIRKLKGGLMRPLGPDGLPLLLVNPDGAVFHNLGATPNHLTLILTDSAGNVQAIHATPVSKLTDAAAALGPLLAMMKSGAPAAQEVAP